MYFCYPGNKLEIIKSDTIQIHPNFFLSTYFVNRTSICKLRIEVKLYLSGRAKITNKSTVNKRLVKQNVKFNPSKNNTNKCEVKSYGQMTFLDQLEGLGIKKRLK